MLKKKSPPKQDYHSQLKKIVRFQNQSSFQFHITWLNPKKEQCKAIQSKHYCFCGHYLSHHLCSQDQTIHKCTADGCKCPSFCFVPDLNLKCICGHAPYRHDLDHQCKQCTSCVGFITDWHCQCGYRYEQHSTQVSMLKENNPLIIRNQLRMTQETAHKRTQKNADNEMEDTANIRTQKTKGKKTEQNTDKRIKRGANTSLPNIKPTGIRYPIEDHVKESRSLVQLKATHCFFNSVDAQSQHQVELKEKLRKANLRYFSKFKPQRHQADNNEWQGHEQTNQINGLDLYIQPHLFRPCSLSKHIKVLTAIQR